MAGDDRRRGEIVTASRWGNENQKPSSETPLLKWMGGFTIETLSKFKTSLTKASSRCFDSQCSRSTPFKPLFQYRPIEPITRILVESFRAKVMKELSVKSVNNCVNLLYAIFRKGEEWGMVERNPVRIKALKVAEQKYAWWEKKEDVVQFLKVAEQSPYYVAFRLAVECGLCLGEIVGLSKQDVSLERNQLHIHRQWIDKEGAYGPTKGRRERFVPFHPDSELKVILKEAMERSRHAEAIAVTRTGTRVLNRKLSGYHFNKLVEEAKVPKIRFHDLRHTFASWYMIEVGDIWSLKGILGHVDVQTTQRYAHLSQRHQKMPAFGFHVGK